MTFKELLEARRAGRLWPPAKVEYTKPTLYLRGKVWWIRYTVRGQLIRFSLKTKDRATAEREELRLRNQLAGVADPRPEQPATWEEFWPRELERRAPALAPNTVHSYGRLCRALDRWLAARVDVRHPTPLADITAALIEDFHADRLQRIKPTTANTDTGGLHVMFEQARRRGLIRENPVQCGTEKVPRRRPRVVTDREIDLLLAAAQDDATRAVLMIARDTGMRTAEIANLRWADIDLATGLIILPAEVTKTKTARYTPPLTAPTLALLWQMHRATAEAHVVRRDKWAPKWALRRVMRSIAEAAKAAGVDVRLREFRRRRATELYASGFGMAEEAALMGHSPETAARHYVDMGEVGRKAAEALRNMHNSG